MNQARGEGRGGTGKSAVGTRTFPLTVMHVSSFRFGPRHHPATYRTIVGLSHHFRTVVLCGKNPGYIPPDLEEDGCTEAADAGIHLVAEQDTHALGTPEGARSVAAAIQQRYGPIHALVEHLGCRAHVLHLARHLAVPILSIFHGDDANIELRGARYGPDYARLRRAPAAYFLAVSHNLVERLIDFGMPPERTFLHHLGVDLASYPVSERRETRGPVKIVMAGRMRRHKGHAMAIRGFAELVRRFPGASLHFVGAGATSPQRQYEEELLALVKRMGLAGAIRFRGAMAVDRLMGEFASADIALQTSVFDPEASQVEGIPNTILEAMATGLPVVATRHGGIPEAVLHQRTGLLVEEHDVDGLSQALGRLAADAGLRRRYGRAARRWVEEEFDSVRQSQRLAERVRQMCDAYASLDRPEWTEAWEEERDG